MKKSNVCASFKECVVDVLKEKGYDKKCHALEMFLNSIEFNSKNNSRKVWINKYSGLFLLTSIPIISASLSVLINLKSQNDSLSYSLVFGISIALTLFAILNSIFTPGEKFQLSCEIGIMIDNFKIGFLIDLERLDSIEDSSLLELIDKKKDEFETYQKMLISLFMPKNVDAQQTSSGN